jgi:hypothetical protein
MIILLPLLRRLGIRSGFVSALLTLVAVAFVINLLMHSLVLLLVAAVFIAGACRSGRIRRPAA